jgi:hypothetical protein
MENGFRQQVVDDVYDLDTGCYGYAQLAEMYRDVDGVLSDDDIAEICQDLGRADGPRNRDMILVGYLLGVSAATDEEEYDE